MVAQPQHQLFLQHPAGPAGVFGLYVQVLIVGGEHHVEQLIQGEQVLDQGLSGRWQTCRRVGCRVPGGGGRLRVGGKGLGDVELFQLACGSLRHHRGVAGNPLHSAVVGAHHLPVAGKPHVTFHAMNGECEGLFIGKRAHFRVAAFEATVCDDVHVVTVPKRYESASGHGSADRAGCVTVLRTRARVRHCPVLRVPRVCFNTHLLSYTTVHCSCF